MRLILAILACSVLSAFGTSYTSTQNGNWSATSTWGGSGPPGNGDTATISHIVTVDTDTTVGTSPNDTTTFVVTDNSTLVIQTNVTLTVKGSLSVGNFNTLTMNPGSNLIFDNSASGGSPVYKIADNNPMILQMLGSPSNRCTMSAIPGQTFYVAKYMNFSIFTNAVFLRLTGSSLNIFSIYDGPLNMVGCTFDSCGLLQFNSLGGSLSNVIRNCNWTNGTTTEALRLQFTGTNNLFLNNSVDKYVTYTSRYFIIATNAFLGGFAQTGGNPFFVFRNNLVGQLIGSDLQNFSNDVERNYFTNPNANPHYIGADNSVNLNISQNIFEGYCPDLIDTGDAIIDQGTGTAGEVLIGRNNIVLPSSYPATTLSSGTMLTLFNAGVNISTKWYRNTANTDKSGVTGNRGMFAAGEGGSGSPDQIAEMKSNLAWGSSANQGPLGEYVFTTMTNIITPAGSDYNWLWNSAAGNNQRGYNTDSHTNTMWAAGDAVAAGVDVHQGTGNPSFYDSSRNLAKWCFERGYGTQTYTNGLSVIQADPLKIPDLIDYVFEGYRPTNAALRSAAHDGGVVGAANFDKTSRSLAATARYRATLTAFGL